MITKVESFRISFLSDVFQVCAGMNGNSLQGAAGVGKAVADWVIKGYPPGDMLHFEVQRFAAQHNNAKFLSEKTICVLALTRLFIPKTGIILYKTMTATTCIKYEAIYIYVIWLR